MITQEKLRKVLEYDPDKGMWTWLNAGVYNAQYTGKRAGTISVHGYRVITLGGEKYRSARLAHFYMTGLWPEYEMDHEDRNKTNDCWNNLRVVTRSENALNRDLQSNNTSGVRGVHWDVERGKWAVVVKKDGVTHHIGRYDSLGEAIEARNDYAEILQGDFAILNTPMENVA